LFWYAETAFHPLAEGGVCALLMMSIFQSAFALKYPRDPFPPMPTPVKPFNTPANSPAVSQQTKSKILSPTVRPLELNRAPVYSLGFTESDAAETKTIQPFQFYPLDLYIPHLTRLDPVKDVELQVPSCFSLQRLDELQYVDVYERTAIAFPIIELPVDGVSGQAFPECRK
jgi:hypothetical protein